MRWNVIIALAEIESLGSCPGAMTNVLGSMASSLAAPVMNDYLQL
jgi:hypothetical protein